MVTKITKMILNVRCPVRILMHNIYFVRVFYFIFHWFMFSGYIDVCAILFSFLCCVFPFVRSFELLIPNVRF